MSIEEEVRLAIKLINHGFKSDNGQFDRVTPAYAFNTEDSASVFKKYKDYINGQSVLTVTGSGDAILDLILRGAKRIVAFDTNAVAKHMADLKLACIKARIDYDEYVRFFCGECSYGDQILNKETYEKVKHFLSPKSRYFFHCLYEYMDKNDIKLKNSDTSLLYQQFDGFLHFPTLNYTMYNSNGYLSKENYEILLDKLSDTESVSIKFIDSDILDLDGVLDEEFAFMYLSNIIDFTSEILTEETLEERLLVFKSYLESVLSKFLIKNGIMIAGFMRNFRPTGDDIYYDIREYDKIFDYESNFLMDDLWPDNKDHVLVFASKEKIYEQRMRMYDFF